MSKSRPLLYNSSAPVAEVEEPSHVFVPETLNPVVDVHQIVTTLIRRKDVAIIYI